MDRMESIEASDELDELSDALKTAGILHLKDTFIAQKVSVTWSSLSRFE